MYRNILTLKIAFIIWNAQSCTSHPAVNTEGMGFIGLALEAFSPCTDYFITMEREIGRRPSEENYWKGYVHLDDYKGIPEARIEIKLDNPAVFTISSDIARVYSEGTIFRLFPYDVNDRITFEVKAPQGKPFPNIEWVKLNEKSVCINPKKMSPTLLGSQPVALGTVTVSPKDFVPFCGRRQNDFSPLIVNGAETKYGDWPWHVAMFTTSNATNNRKYICGGTLISPRTVVTAAHCVTVNGEIRDPKSLVLIMGKFRLNANDAASQERQVSTISVHENYDFKIIRNDIATVNFENKVEYTQHVQPICLWPENDLTKENLFGVNGTVVGWGINENNTMSQEMRAGNMSVVSDTECLLSYANFFQRFVYDGSFCAGKGRFGGPAACNGDSGGGFVVPRVQPDGKISYFLRGIVSLSVSRSNGLCNPEYYAVFTDTAQFLPWINERRLS